MMRCGSCVNWRLSRWPLLICAVLVLWVSHEVRAHPPQGISAILIVDWGNEKTCDLRIRLNGLRINTVEPVQPQRILVEVEDAAGNAIGPPVIDQTFSQPTPAAGIVIDEEESLTVQPNSGVHQVRFSWWDNGTAGEPTGFVIRNVPGYCPNIESETELNSLISCGDCGGLAEDLPESAVQVYKSTNTVFALIGDDDSGASYGETVSGSFKAPKCGILKTQVTGVSDNAKVFLEGWDGAGNPATNNTTYVKRLNANELYKFGIEAVKGEQPDVTIKFDWYTWKDDEQPPSTDEDCLDHYEYKTNGTPGLVFTIQEIPFKTVPVEDGVELTLSGLSHEAEGTTWYELEIPGCHPKGGAGNMTEKFILSINGDGLIPDGHALNWRKSGGTIVAPDPDGEVFAISGLQ